MIASGSRDGTVRLWHPKSGEELRVLSHEHEEHSRNSSPVHRRQSLDSSKGKRDSFSSSGGTYAKSQQFSNGRVTNTGIPSKVSCLKINTQTKNQLCSGAEDGSMWLWDMEAGQPTRVLLPILLVSHR